MRDIPGRQGALNPHVAGMDKAPRIPSHKVGHFIYYDCARSRSNIRTKLKVPARG